MKHVWLVSDNMDGFETKAFSSKFLAASYFKEVLSDNKVSFDKIIETGSGKNYSCLYNEDFWIHLQKVKLNV